MAKTDKSTETTGQEKRLAAEAKMAGYRKTIAEAREAEAKADKTVSEAEKAMRETDNQVWKAPEVKALEGKLTATGNFIETQILANKCLTALIAELVEKMKNDPQFNGNQLRLVLYNMPDFPAMELYIVMMKQLQALMTVFSDVITAGKNALSTGREDQAGGFGPLTTGFAIAGILRTSADIFSLFKSNTSYTNYALTVDDNMVASCFVNAVKEKKLTWKVYYPAAYPVNTIDGRDTDSAFLKLFTEVKAANNTAVYLEKDIETKLADVEAQLTTETDTAKKIKLQELREKLSDTSMSMQGATAIFSQLETLFLTIDQTTKTSPLTIITRAEKMADLVTSADTYIIKIIASSNGSTMIRENLFRTTKAFHSGGTQLNCLVFSKDGSICFSYASSKYIPGKETSEIITALNS